MGGLGTALTVITAITFLWATMVSLAVLRSFRRHERLGPPVTRTEARTIHPVDADEAARSLISALMTGELPEQDAAERLGGRWAVPAMVAVLEDQRLARSLVPETVPSKTWRTSVVGALGAAADRRAELTLARVLDSSRTDERAAAARALGSSGTEAAVPVLIAALDDPEWEVRNEAAGSISRHTWGYAARPLEALASRGPRRFRRSTGRARATHA
jgi:HEAT repeat protein